MKNKDKSRKDINDESSRVNSERYTVFCAVFKALKEKDRKRKEK